MPEKITWSFSAAASAGPRIAGSGELSIGAYDKLKVDIDVGATDVSVQLQPSTTAGQVDALLLAASLYDARLTFAVDADPTTFPFEAPVVLLGSGAVKLLADPPQSLRFTNQSESPVTVDILVGRQTT